MTMETEPPCPQTGFERDLEFAIHPPVVLTIANERPHKCSFAGCTAAFPYPQALQVHYRVHSGDRPYTCEVAGCNAAFKQKSHLTPHVRTHSNERPYNCTFEGCEAAFKQSNDLTSHLRTHTKINPYKCDYPGCSVAFAQSCNLISHKKTHSGERPFICPVENCDETFSRKEHLQRHDFEHHTRQGQVKKKRQEARILRLFQKEGLEFKTQHLIDFTCVGADREGYRAYIDFLIMMKSSRHCAL